MIKYKVTSTKLIEIVQKVWVVHLSNRDFKEIWSLHF